MHEVYGRRHISTLPQLYINKQTLHKILAKADVHVYSAMALGFGPAGTAGTPCLLLYATTYSNSLSAVDPHQMQFSHRPHLSYILAGASSMEQSHTVMLIWQHAVKRLLVLHLHLVCPLRWPAIAYVEHCAHRMPDAAAAYALFAMSDVSWSYMHDQNVTLLYTCIMQGELSMSTSVHFTESVPEQQTHHLCREFTIACYSAGQDAVLTHCVSHATVITHYWLICQIIHSATYAL